MHNAVQPWTLLTSRVFSSSKKETVLLASLCASPLYLPWDLGNHWSSISKDLIYFSLQGFDLLLSLRIWNADISYKWSHRVCGFLCLASFTWQMTQCWSMCIDASFLFYDCILFHWMNISPSVHWSMKHMGCFGLLYMLLLWTFNVYVFVWGNVSSSLGKITSLKTSFFQSFLVHSSKQAPTGLHSPAVWTDSTWRRSAVINIWVPGYLSSEGTYRLKEGGPIYLNWDTWKAWKEKRNIMSSKLKNGRTMRATRSSPESDTSVACTMSPSCAFERPLGKKNFL